MLFFWKLSSPKLPGWSSLSHNWKCRCIRIFGHSNILLCQPWWVWASLWKPVTLSHPLIKLCSSFFQVPIRSSHDFLKAYIVGKKNVMVSTASGMVSLHYTIFSCTSYDHVPNSDKTHRTSRQEQPEYQRDKMNVGYEAGGLRPHGDCNIYCGYFMYIFILYIYNLKYIYI